MALQCLRLSLTLLIPLLHIPAAITRPLDSPALEFSPRIPPSKTRSKRELSVKGFDLSGAYYSYKQQEPSSASKGYLTDNYSEVIAKTLERADHYINSISHDLRSAELWDVAQSTTIGGSYIGLIILSFFTRMLFRKLSKVESSTLSSIPAIKQSLQTAGTQQVKEDKLESLLTRLSQDSLSRVSANPPPIRDVPLSI